MRIHFTWNWISFLQTFQAFAPPRWRYQTYQWQETKDEKQNKKWGAHHRTNEWTYNCQQKFQTAWLTSSDRSQCLIMAYITFCWNGYWLTLYQPCLQFKLIPNQWEAWNHEKNTYYRTWQIRCKLGTQWAPQDSSQSTIVFPAPHRVGEWIFPQPIYDMGVM